MKKSRKLNKIIKLLFWAPRILAIIFTLFLTLFAFDVFDTGEPWYVQAVGFLMHLVPNIIIVFVLVVTWRREMIGGFAFLFLYLAGVLLVRAEMTGLILFSPVILIGVLFLIHSSITLNKS